MKKSTILLELIFSILILSVVGIYSLLFINDLYKSNAQNLTLLNSKLDLQTTNLFIENKLKQSVNINLSSSAISFYEIDVVGFKNDWYSGFVLLEKSTKEFVFTPQSYISKTNNRYIWFEDGNIYEIEKSIEDNKISFKNKSEQKKIYEQYKLLKSQSKIFLKQNQLFFNDNVLLNNIKSFEVKQSNKALIIDICDNRCHNWVIAL